MEPSSELLTEGLEKFPKKFQWLFENGPSIPIVNAPQNIQIIQSPSEFHQTMIDLAANATERIGLSTLYMGNDDETQQLLRQCEKTVHHNPNLYFHLVCDYARGNRGGDSTRAATLKLKQTYPKQFRLSMFHTPCLRGWRKRILPGKLAEVIGVQHAKIYIFDNTVIMSGANLSKIYFTNRQDRYVVFKQQPALCNYLFHVIRVLQKLSIEITENDEECANSLHPTDCDMEEFVKLAQDLFEPLIMPREWGGKYCNKGPGKYTTWVFPTIQAYQLGVQFDSATTNRLVRSSFDYNSELFVSTGYFNLAKDFSDALLNTRSNKVDILMASDQANGFYKGKGILGNVPDMYKYLAVTFSDVLSRCRLDKVILTEWRKPAWSFHGKGLWYWDRGEQDGGEFFCNIVGSSNFGVRSYYRDTETQLIMVTMPGSEDTAVLSEKFKMEQDNLWHREYSTVLSQDMKRVMWSEIPKWITYASTFLRNYF